MKRNYFLSVLQSLNVHVYKIHLFQSLEQTKLVSLFLIFKNTFELLTFLL